jgi:acetyl-CoA synthetase
MSGGRGEGAKAFLAARELLLDCGGDYERARREFRWPQLGAFNWALDYFDEFARGNRQAALWIVEEGADGKQSEHKISFEEISRRSNQVAGFLRRQGVERGDRIILMLPNVPATWETILAAMKLGAVVIPAATLLTTEDLHDRLERGKARHVVATVAATEKFAKLPGDYTRIVVGEGVGGGIDGEISGWTPYARAYDEPANFAPDAETEATDPLLLYFTSGTTALPKLVLHTHESYPVGHLATMYWLGIRPGDIHLNISSPGWAKHAWSCFFAPWNAEATIFIHGCARFDAKATLRTISRCGVRTMCAPPTVWRMLVLEDLGAYRMQLRELASAGEPLNPEVIAKVRQAWHLTIRDAYGQTENVCLLGNFPGQTVKPGAVGKPSPGHEIVLLDHDGNEADDGEIAMKLEPRPPSLMVGYLDDEERTAAAMAGGYYRTGDVAHRDADGYFTYVGRADDVFKSSDYRISPFELESALIECKCVAEAAVVPSPDALRWSVPKAFLVLKPGVEASVETAREIFVFIRGRLGPYKRVRRIEFAELPKTISGKIRRVELRAVEIEARRMEGRRAGEYWEEDFPDVK